MNIKFKKSQITHKLISVLLITVFVLGLGIGWLIGHPNSINKLKTITTKISEWSLLQYRQLVIKPPEKLELVINSEDWIKIVKQRAAAIDQGILLTSDEDFVDGKIIYQGETLPIKLRLKGDWTDHLSGNKWSFRIHVKDGQAIRGMSKFSIQDPVTRGNLNEWVILQALKQAGLIALRYDLIDVWINGQNKGVFAIEEHFDKQLIEYNQRREGIILKLSEDQLWKDRVRYGVNEDQETGLYYRSLIEPFGENSIQSDEKLLNQFNQAEYLLRQYQAGKLSVEQVFDTDQWATWFALSDVFGVRHGLAWHNIRFYYNPVSGLIEPIGFDMEAGERLVRLAFDLDRQQYELTKILDHPAVQRKYLQQLKKISQTKYLDDFFSSTNPQLDQLVKYLNRESNYQLNKSIWYDNQQFISKKLTHNPGIRAFINQQHQLQIIPLTELPIEVVEIKQNTHSQWQSNSGVLIPPASRDQVTQVTNQDWQINNLKPNHTDISYRYAGLNDIYQVPVKSWIWQTIDQGLPQKGYPPSFVHVDYQNQKYLIPSGQWQLKQNLIVPAGWSLEVQSGASLDLTNHSGIISHGTVEMNGESDSLIKITSSDQTGQGLLVLRASEKSTLSNVEFSNLTNLSVTGNNLTGAITFYQSAVEIKQTLFTRIRAEDTLNIVNSPFKITDSSFIDLQQDGLDVDFGNGEITNTIFKKVSNDAIDFSGSRIVIDQSLVIEAGDKAVSVGESSQIDINQLTVQQSRTAVAVKDLSQVNLKLLTAEQSEIGVAVYEKKPEYGPAYLDSWGAIFNDVNQPWLIEQNSIVIENGVKRIGQEQDVFVRFYQ